MSHDYPGDYIYSARAALTATMQAMRDAQAILPPEIAGCFPLLIGSSRSAAAWAKVEAWYGTQADRDQNVWDTLTDLKLLAEAAACLTTVVKSREREGVTPNLRLAKQRGTT